MKVTVYVPDDEVKALGKMTVTLIYRRGKIEQVYSGNEQLEFEKEEEDGKE